MRHLILLDVDGVLVHPAGYKAALCATVDHFAAQMGLPPVELSHDEIAVFEACGITNEWDSGAMCASALLLAALEHNPTLRRPSLSATLSALRAATASVPRPDFMAMARDIAHHNNDGHVPSALYLELLAGRADTAALPLLAELLANVYDIITPTTRMFQALTLGSAQFTTTYGQVPPFESESYLVAHDAPLLDDDSRDALLDWTAGNEHGTAIYTARPSLPPADVPGVAPMGYTPEAELARELLHLEDVVLIGQGRVSWLAAQHGRSAPEYIKPAPVQALAAIGAAASGTEMSALLAAADLFEHARLSSPLTELRGEALHVTVFEDSTGGIRAVRSAVGLLRQVGLKTSFRAVGVSPHPEKRAALAPVADDVVDDINAGLELVLS
ncbi:MAG: hypothetical protein GYB65_01425 [Chloroflexi bacterium]|nr:hypothetical protein [Chloroflexota bacterium]